MSRDFIISVLTQTFKLGNKVLICGNGGSAAMAQHMAAEFMGKFEFNRPPLPALALTTDTSFITAYANDYPDGFDQIFSRQLEAFGKTGDALVVFSTSGKSKNCLRAIEMAKLLHMVVIEFPIEGQSTAEIQEFQFKLMHDVCRVVERNCM